jgi:integrase/recombinase XerC
MSHPHLPAVVIPHPPRNLTEVSPGRRLVQAFLAGRSAATLRSYRGDLRDFARWCGPASVEAAGEVLLAAGPGGANEAALHYRAHLVGRGLAAATVNRRLAALRSLTKMGRTLGLNCLLKPRHLAVCPKELRAIRRAAGRHSA